MGLNFSTRDKVLMALSASRTSMKPTPSNTHEHLPDCYSTGSSTLPFVSYESPFLLHSRPLRLQCRLISTTSILSFSTPSLIDQTLLRSVFLRSTRLSRWNQIQQAPMVPPSLCYRRLFQRQIMSTQLSCQYLPL